MSSDLHLNVKVSDVSLHFGGILRVAMGDNNLLTSVSWLANINHRPLLHTSASVYGARSARVGGPIPPYPLPSHDREGRPTINAMYASND